jgi:alpha-beta hydrolase superfamily lysophospholipase
MNKIEIRQHQIPAADGTPLHVRDALLAPGTPGVVIMHGLGEHSGRYERAMQFFNQCGLSVRAYDHRGHGQSGGKRGDFPESDPSGGDAVVQDARIVIDDFARQTGHAPILLGHSMGGLFATRFALEKHSPLRALILSSPALALSLSGGQKGLLKILSAIAPHFAVANGLDVNGLSHDPAVAKAYQNDPFVHNKATASLLKCMLASIDYCHAKAGTMSVPVLLVVAGDDKLIAAEGSRAIFPKLPPDLATMHWYDHMYHELFHETEADAARVFGDIRAWLLARKLIAG